LESSCADLIRASTSLFRVAEGVDGRVKPGQDETREPISFLLPPQDFPRTALRTAGEGAERSKAGEGRRRKGKPSPSQPCGLAPALSRGAGEGQILNVGELRAVY
jgi:hypothetical protein